jgi:hypothetical protein
VRCVGAEHPQDPMSVYTSTYAHTGLFSPTGSAIFISNRMFLDHPGFGCLIEISLAVHGALNRSRSRIAAVIRANPDSSTIPTDAPTSLGQPESFPNCGRGGLHRFPVLSIRTALTFVSTRVEDPVRYGSDKTQSSTHDAPSIRLTP